MSGQVSIVIVNWNAGNQLIDAVCSIAQNHANLVASVVIVDNASTDDSLAQVEALYNWPFQVQIIRNSENRGFAAACNQGATVDKSEYLLFLNPDTRLFNGSLTKPINLMGQSENAHIGICGIRLVDGAGNGSTSAARFPTLRVMTGAVLGLSKFFPSALPAHFMSILDLHESAFVDQVIGAFFLIRRNVFDLCSGFDEQFFVYFEEVDLSIRAKQLGYLSYFLSNASAFHKGGGCSERVKAARLFYSLRSRILYAKKHYSKLEYVALIALTAFELPLRLVNNVLMASLSDIGNTLSAYRQLVAHYLRRA